MDNKDILNRRTFLSSVGAAGTVGAFWALSGNKAEAKGLGNPMAQELPPLLETAPDGKLLKAGLVGCGGRGTGAAFNFLNAGPNLEITALADVFQDRLDSCREKLRTGMAMEVSEKNCFIGFDAYKKVLDCDVDIVLMATPPYFRPEHFRACINARKHVFMEKPVAVDPVGARSIMASSKKAQAIGLSVVTGTQRRHQLNYIETFKQIQKGAIGEIVGANCYWNQSQLWYKNRQDGWSDMEHMIRDWVNWCWLSGDHIVEQHVHNIDVINWFTGMHPEKAVGFGARHRRVTGDQYDFFSVDFIYPNGMHVHSMCRQINGCTNNVSEFIQGTKGFSNCRDTIYKPDGSQVWKYDQHADASMRSRPVKPYDQEHVDLITAIRTNKPIVEAEGTAISTLCAIMGRISAYTGKEVTWDEMMNSGLKLGPEKCAMGPVDLKVEIPVPGAS
jgi:predicted dehydrogenase